MRSLHWKSSAIAAILVSLSLCLMQQSAAAEAAVDELAKTFETPPPETRPWVYWFFMDGNLTREGMTADLEAMKRAGIGGGIFLEVNLGVPRGPVAFMSDPWRELVKHAIKEAQRLGLQIAMGSGPGWCGTGGPWIKPEQSMQHLVASETAVTGPKHFDGTLPQPAPRTPYFGENTLTPELHKVWKEFYRDVVVLAFPTPQDTYRIPNFEEKALYFRDPYSSKPGVKPFLTPDHTTLPPEQCISADKIVQLKLSNGRLVWDVPPGNWTIVRFGRTITGQTTRPAPLPGLGLECDKFEKAAMDAHFDAFIGTLLKVVGEPKESDRGLTTLHFDSWEMSSQNWSEHFREEFQRRRGYDPVPYLPAMLGRVVRSVEVSERFLWDLRRTAQELVVENDVGHLHELARRHGMRLSLEPYDLNPAGDLELGSAADVPMGEFWSRGTSFWGFPTEFSCFEAVSVGHTLGRNIIAAESFTADPGEDWRQYPGAMKSQADWALCCGLNRLVIHRYQHQPWLDRFPGMTMGPYGVHWERTQTWWDMAPAFHTYLARCQAMLRRGLPVADILYLDQEGAPNVFCPPSSAVQSGLPDRRGYNFDGCAPGALIRLATVKDGRIALPGGMSYRLLVLPRVESMTPALLRKIRDLANAGAKVLGAPPQKSPSLSGFPQCDAEAKQLAAQIRSEPVDGGTGLYPSYDAVAARLAKMEIVPDFQSNGDLRYTHRRDGDADIYFVGNRTGTRAVAECRFRVSDRQPELWNPVTGEMRALPEFRQDHGRTVVPLQFAPAQSFFVIFRQKSRGSRAGANFPKLAAVSEIAGPWNVAFDPKRGGPSQATFQKLEDWTTRREPGIRYYSGEAVYRKVFDAPVSADKAARLYLELGKVSVMAQVKLNGKDLGVLWCSPWRVVLPAGLLKPVGNQLEITVANLWPNRLIRDAGLPEGQRLTWTTRNPYRPTDPLLPSGLRGPVRLVKEDY